MQIITLFIRLRPHDICMMLLPGAFTQIYLDGTIPMIYLNVKYNCPIQIWFNYNYPKEAPTCVVVPIPSMRIVPRHANVAADGLVRHQYLANWTSGSSLEGLYDELSSAFGQSPPIYTAPVPASAPTPAPAARPTTSAESHREPVSTPS